MLNWFQRLWNGRSRDLPELDIQKLQYQFLEVSIEEMRKVKLLLAYAILVEQGSVSRVLFRDGKAGIQRDETGDVVIQVLGDEVAFTKQQLIAKVRFRFYPHLYGSDEKEYFARTCLTLPFLHLAVDRYPIHNSPNSIRFNTMGVTASDVS